MRIVVLSGLFLLVYWQTIERDLVWKWTHDGNWSHGWLVPLFSLYFLASRRDQLARCPDRPSYVGAVVMALSLAVGFVGGWGLRFGYVMTLSMLGVLWGLMLLLGGWAWLRIGWFAVAFLFFAMPLPQEIYARVTMPLRILASQAAAAIMPLFVSGLYTEAQSVVIDYSIPGKPPGSLNVEDACSGMRLMMSFVALGVAMAYLGNRPTWQRIIMVLCCVPIAIMCNTIRVVLTGLLHVYGYQEYAAGTPHQLLGIAMLLLALGSYALIGWVLSNVYVDQPVNGALGQSERTVGRTKP